MAGIVVAVGIGDADDRAIERVVGITHRLDEGLAQEQREASVAITCQSLAKSVGHFLASCRRGWHLRSQRIIVNA
jgi:hypothetical protein